MRFLFCTNDPWIRNNEFNASRKPMISVRRLFIAETESGSKSCLLKILILQTKCVFKILIVLLNSV